MTTLDSLPLGAKSGDGERRGASHRDEQRAKSAQAAPGKSDITKWDLAELIDVAVELKLVSSGVSKLSHPIREYRNLVHPGNEIRKALEFAREEARIVLEVLNILHRDLTS